MKKFAVLALAATLSMIIGDCVSAQTERGGPSYRIGLTGERLVVEPDETYPGRYTLFWEFRIPVPARVPVALNLIGECSLVPLGRWTTAGKDRFARRLHGVDGRFYYEKLPVATIDLPEESGTKSTPPILRLFTADQAVKIKLRISLPGTEVAALGEQDYSLNVYGYALLDAAEAGNLPLVTDLVANGASVNAATDLNWTALMAACSSGNPAIVRLLLDKGAQVNARHQGFPFVVSDLGNRVPAGGTALMIAAYGGNPEIVRLLLAAGAKVNYERNDHWTALTMASYSGSVPAVGLLLDNGARVNQLDQTGYSPMALAIINGNGGVVRLLKARGGAIRVPWDRWGD
jgi:hypothetical protein